jgi:hypothetical protein
MHVGIVGGMDRAAPHYRSVAEERGHTLECHTGDLAGTGPSTLESIVQRADLIVVVTDLNSHGAVWQARRLARQHSRAVVFVRRLGVARLRQIVESHATTARDARRVANGV